ncbi:4-(cytidine 5'-diphospho)-2-C-methyl-D-erythritol kinase [candidate division KSB1 bacterium]|nr:4-(cytidine 5'-diphospho)-2-C-methyl-D-erythritol kinase [candidate division KSB1 bacterium]
MIIKAPAKINFGLWIGVKREDNYHPVSTIFVPVTLYDVLKLEITKTAGIRFNTGSSEIPGDNENLCWKAAERFLSRAGLSSGVNIDLEKNIPVEAGMGGGSSDAAAVLSGLSKLHPETLSKKEIFDIAVTLGADVPFFLQDSPCSASGIGEILDPVDFSRIFSRPSKTGSPHGFILLVIPSFPTCSADAYAEFDRQLAGSPQKYGSKPAPVDYAEILQSLTSISDAKNSVANDFEPVLFPHYPELEEIKQKLYNAGADYASLTGSGSVVYGMFLAEDNARKAEVIFKESYRTEVVQPIS